MKITYLKGLLMNLAGEVPESKKRLFLPKEVARQKLIEATGVDLEFDAAAWRTWIRSNRAVLKSRGWPAE
jgi:hypothetical protein